MSMNNYGGKRKPRPQPKAQPTQGWMGTAKRVPAPTKVPRGSAVPAGTKTQRETRAHNDKGPLAQRVDAYRRYLTDTSKKGK